MRYTIPHYYREFSCAADRCTDTCCAGWEIMIDPASLKKYRKTKGPLGNRLHNSIRWDQGSFKQYRSHSPLSARKAQRRPYCLKEP